MSKNIKELIFISKRIKIATTYNYGFELGIDESTGLLSSYDRVFHIYIFKIYLMYYFN